MPDVDKPRPRVIQAGRHKRPIGIDPLDMMVQQQRAVPLSKDDMHRILQDAVRNTAAMTPPKDGERKHAKRKATRASRSG